MNARIRQSQASDREALLQLVAELQEFERSIDDRLLEGQRMAPAYLDGLELRCKEQRGAILVAELEGKVVGFVAVQSKVPSTELDEPPGDHAWISDLAVAEAHRGKGLGRALLAAADAFARQLGANDVRIGALSENEAAVGLYRALGFEPYLQTFSKRS